MAKQQGYLYDVFISYNAADQDWVATVLLPRLEGAGLRVAVGYRDFVVGKPLIENIEAAVETSRRTVVVLSPEWLASEWNAFEALLVRAEDPAATRRRLLPLRLRPCELPGALVKLKLDVADLTAERYKEVQLKRLVRDVEDVVPVPLPANVRDWGAWRRWLRRYRRGVRWAAAGAVVLWLVVALLTHAFPFRWLFEWQAVAARLPTVGWALHSNRATLLVGAENSREGCERAEQGIWYWPLTGERFLPSEIAVSLCVEDWKTRSPSIVSAFASRLEEPETIYALTSHSPVLVSRDGGKRFDAFAPPAPPAEEEAQGALLLGVQFETPVTLWVAGGQDGLWRYRDGGWVRMDGGGEGSCTGLPFAHVTALLAAEEHVLIGTDRKGLWRTADGGRTCQAVFDKGPRSQYQFYSLAAVGNSAPGRYLALVYDTQVDRSYRLLDLCGRPEMCTDAEWRGEALKWSTTSDAVQVLTQDDDAGNVTWYVLAKPFHVFFGLVGDPDHDRTQLFVAHAALRSEVALARAGAGKFPYLLVGDRVFRYEPGGRK